MVAVHMKSKEAAAFLSEVVVDGSHAERNQQSPAWMGSGVSECVCTCAFLAHARTRAHMHTHARVRAHTERSLHDILRVNSNLLRRPLCKGARSCCISNPRISQVCISNPNYLSRFQVRLYFSGALFCLKLHRGLCRQRSRPPPRDTTTRVCHT